MTQALLGILVHATWMQAFVLLWDGMTISGPDHWLFGKYSPFPFSCARATLRSVSFDCYCTARPYLV